MNGNNEVLIGEARKNPSSVLKIFIGEYNRRTYVYIQAWDKDEGDLGEGTPTHRGLTMRPDVLRALLPLFSKAIEKAAVREREKRVRACDA